MSGPRVVDVESRRLRAAEIQGHERLYSPLPLGTDARQRLVHEGGVSFGRPVVSWLPACADTGPLRRDGDERPRVFGLVAFSFDVDEPAGDRRLAELVLTIELHTEGAVAHSLWPALVTTPVEAQRASLFTVQPDLQLGPANGHPGGPGNAIANRSTRGPRSRRPRGAEPQTAYRYSCLSPAIIASGCGLSRFSWSFAARPGHPLLPVCRTVFAVLDLPMDTEPVRWAASVEATFVGGAGRRRARTNRRVSTLDRHPWGSRRTGDPVRTPEVFISYAHDSRRHVRRVLELAEFLAGRGIRVHLDQWADDSRRDWGHWATDRIRHCDYVLVVASPDYKRVGDGFATRLANLGAQSEAALIRDLLHRDRPTWLPRLLPVILPGRSLAEVPDFLQPYAAGHYRITDFSNRGAEELLRVLTRQPAWVPPALGPLPVLPPRSSAS
jgi:hypothetical protein